MNQTLSSKIEELQRRWRTEQWENDRPYNPIGAAGVCADELTPLLELARKMERAAYHLSWATEVEIQGGHRTRAFISQHRAKCRHWIAEVRKFIAGASE